jgi:hypothetical protein
VVKLQKIKGKDKMLKVAREKEKRHFPVIASGTVS